MIVVVSRVHAVCAVQRRAVQELCVRLDQNGSLHNRACAHLDLTGDLPEDFLRKSTVSRAARWTRSSQKAPRRLHDEDSSVVFLSVEDDFAGEGDIDAKFVDASSQSLSSNGAAKVIDLLRGSTSGGVGVRSFHVTDRGGQFTRNYTTVTRRMGLARDLLGFRKLSSRVQDQGNASNDVRSDGRDADVAVDDGRGRS
jgi:hypothetical protein